MLKNGYYDANSFTNIDAEIKRLVYNAKNDKRNIYKGLSRLKILEYSNILDLGCGPGETSYLISKYKNNLNVVGCDRSDAFIDYAKNNYKNDNLKYLKTDAYNIFFADNTFDVTFSRFMFLHLDKPLDAINQMLRVTKKGGSISIYDLDYGFNQYSETPKNLDLFLESQSRLRRFSGGDIFIGRKLYSMLTNAGVKDIKICYLNRDIIYPGRKILRKGIEMTNNGEHLLSKIGIMTQKQVDEYYADLIRIINDKKSFVNYVGIFIFGKKL